MDGAPDLSKIVGLIMENPDIINRIKELSQKEGSPEADVSCTDTTVQHTKSEQIEAQREKIDMPASETTYKKAAGKKKRTELLCAMKPYVSKERSRAIDTMLSILDVIDIMKER